MLQRIGLAQALINDPDLVFLDEPTSGLDPMGAIQMRQIILDLRNQGKTVFLCSHLLKDMEPMCDRVGILSRGRLRLVGTVAQLLEHGTGYRVEATNVSPELQQKVSGMATNVVERDGELHIETVDQRASLAVAQALSEGGASVLEVGRDRRTLEEVFIDVVQGQAGD
jgi:ABC-2 type transport system ATP-binding protein